MIDFKNDWSQILKEEIEKQYFNQIGVLLSSERQKGKIIYPKSKDYFRALKLCSYEDTKVVIMGQDPYNKSEADGLAFSCNDEVVRLPPSLINILDAIEEDIYSGFIIQEERGLERWANQGILLLNKYLSVERGKPLSHSLFGWDRFTNYIISYLSAKNKPIVFMLWGREAQKIKSLITNKKHLIIECEHPAAAAYANRKWEYNKCFSKCSKFLDETYGKRIEW